VTSSYATYACRFLNSAPTKLMKGDYVAVCIHHCPSFIPDRKNKHVLSVQTYNWPPNSEQVGRMRPPDGSHFPASEKCERKRLRAAAVWGDKE